MMHKSLALGVNCERIGILRLNGKSHWCDIAVLCQLQRSLILWLSIFHIVRYTKCILIMLSAPSASRCWNCILYHFCYSYPRNNNKLNPFVSWNLHISRKSFTCSLFKTNVERSNCTSIWNAFRFIFDDEVFVRFH